MTEYDTVKQVGKHISTESATPTSEGAGPQRPQNFCDPLCSPKRFDLRRWNLVQ